MMPMPATRPRVLAGHNVSFDRARILDEYGLEATSTRFVDTMALHMAVAGLTSQQRGIWKKAMKERQMDAASLALGEAEAEAEAEAQAAGADGGAVRASGPSELPWAIFGDAHTAGIDGEAPAWLDAGATNSLKDVYAFHCGGHIDKSARDIFFTGDLDSIQADLPNLLSYCATDVLRTQEV